MTKTNVQSTLSNSQHHDTPNNKTHVIKFRVTAEEKASLELTCKLLNLSLSTFIRRAIHNVKIEKTVIVAGGGEETLTAVSTLLAQCSKVGGNLNQLARHFNSGGADTEQIRAKLLDELADLTAFRCTPRKFWVNCMATLKHIASKNSDYTAIEAYLVYQHDAFTGKQLLDEHGRPMLRESYILDTLELHRKITAAQVQSAVQNTMPTALTLRMNCLPVSVIGSSARNCTFPIIFSKISQGQARKTG